MPAKIKDKVAFEFNPITGKLDLVVKFNPDRILTHSLNVYGRPMMIFDPATSTYVDLGSQIVTDENGNVVTL